MKKLLLLVMLTGCGFQLPDEHIKLDFEMQHAEIEKEAPAEVVPKPEEMPAPPANEVAK